MIALVEDRNNHRRIKILVSALRCYILFNELRCNYERVNILLFANCCNQDCFFVFRETMYLGSNAALKEPQNLTLCFNIFSVVVALLLGFFVYSLLYKKKNRADTATKNSFAVAIGCYARVYFPFLIVLLLLWVLNFCGMINCFLDVVLPQLHMSRYDISFRYLDFLVLDNYAFFGYICMFFTYGIAKAFHIAPKPRAVHAVE